MFKPSPPSSLNLCPSSRQTMQQEQEMMSFNFHTWGDYITHNTTHPPSFNFNHTVQLCTLFFRTRTSKTGAGTSHCTTRVSQKVLNFYFFLNLYMFSVNVQTHRPHLITPPRCPPVALIKTFPFRSSLSGNVYKQKIAPVGGSLSTQEKQSCFHRSKKN